MHKIFHLWFSLHFFLSFMEIKPPIKFYGTFDYFSRTSEVKKFWIIKLCLNASDAIHVNKHIYLWPSYKLLDFFVNAIYLYLLIKILKNYYQNSCTKIRVYLLKASISDMMSSSAAWTIEMCINIKMLNWHLTNYMVQGTKITC